MATYTESEKENIQAMFWYYKLLDDNDVEGMREFFDPGFITRTHDWQHADGTPMKGPEVIIALAAMLHGALSNLRTYGFEHIMADGPKVSFWAWQEGINDGLGFLMGQPPTGAPWRIRIAHVIYFRGDTKKPYLHDAVRDDKIAVDVHGKQQ